MTGIASRRRGAVSATVTPVAGRASKAVFPIASRSGSHDGHCIWRRADGYGDPQAWGNLASDRTPSALSGRIGPSKRSARGLLDFLTIDDT